MFKAYETVMVLNIRVNDIYCDYKGVFIKEMNRGSKKGLFEVEVNSCKLHLPLEKLINYEEYFKLFNSDKTKLPELAAKKLFFMDGAK